MLLIIVRTVNYNEGVRKINKQNKAGMLITEHAGSGLSIIE